MLLIVIAKIYFFRSDNMFFIGMILTNILKFVFGGTTNGFSQYITSSVNLVVVLVFVIFLENKWSLISKRITLSTRWQIAGVIGLLFTCMPNVLLFVIGLGLIALVVFKLKTSSDSTKKSRFSQALDVLLSRETEQPKDAPKPEAKTAKNSSKLVDFQADLSKND